MANFDHVAILEKAIADEGSELWNEWRLQNPDTLPDLSQYTILKYAKLPDANFRQANLSGVFVVNAYLGYSDFTNANLTSASFSGANFAFANFSATNLSKTDFSNANLLAANFTNASLFETELIGTTFIGSNLTNANFRQTRLGGTVFADTDLSVATGLVTADHRSPSFIDFRTLLRSRGQIPEVFLQGCGVPDTIIAFSKTLVSKVIEYYSCFISYSTADEIFARRLHNDLQANGVRVWFAREDLKIGDPIKPTIDESIRLYDKLIIILSQNSIKRAWVHHEIARALEKEKQHNKHVLFPIRLDDSVFRTTEQWAYDIKERHIGDFTKWDNPLLYQNSINRLLRDLKADSSLPNPKLEGL